MKYEMECTNCHYCYFVSDVVRYEGDVEICPICGHQDKFEFFIVGQSEVEPSK